MRRIEQGFTLIELLIVIGILGLLAAALLPRLMEGQDAANAFGDQSNLTTHHTWMQVYKRKHNDSLPMEGGHRFVLATWTSKIFDHTQENYDRYWTPGPARANDLSYHEGFKLVQRGEDPWPNLQSTGPDDTHYCGRARDHAKTRENSADEAWMADDNEGGWNLRDGTINVLFNGGVVRSYSYQMLQEQYGLGDFDRNKPVETFGPNSPIPQCQKLAN